MGRIGQSVQAPLTSGTSDARDTTTCWAAAVRSVRNPWGGLVSPSRPRSLPARATPATPPPAGQQRYGQSEIHGEDWSVRPGPAHFRHERRPRHHHLLGSSGTVSQKSMGRIGQSVQAPLTSGTSDARDTTTCWAAAVRSVRNPWGGLVSPSRPRSLPARATPATPPPAGQQRYGQSEIHGEDWSVRPGPAHFRHERRPRHHHLLGSSGTVSQKSMGRIGQSVQAPLTSGTSDARDTTTCWAAAVRSVRNPWGGLVSPSRPRSLPARATPATPPLAGQQRYGQSEIHGEDWSVRPGPAHFRHERRPRHHHLLGSSGTVSQKSMGRIGQSVQAPLTSGTSDARDTTTCWAAALSCMH
ncbi:uncharacterized protein [Narcine bancroftii]|uniref:uncharacterized protein n=1 Tax=Narcine bancroftii TaxID=1343680 RepID=UPI00383200A5